jgi:hypothetical protein
VVPRKSSLPHTYVGRWLRALMLDERELRDALVSTLNRGEAIGWNDDEPSVVVACLELSLRRYRSDGPTQEDIESLVSWCEASFAQGSKKPVTATSIQEVLRTALKGQDDRALGVTRYESYRICTVLVGLLSLQADLSEAEVDDLIKESERVAFDRRWHPPLAGRQEPAGGKIQRS